MDLPFGKVYCRRCRRMISVAASRCPACGHDQSRSGTVAAAPKQKTIGLYACGAALLVACGLGIGAVGGNHASPAPVSVATEAVATEAVVPEQPQAADLPVVDAAGAMEIDYQNARTVGPEIRYRVAAPEPEYHQVYRFRSRSSRSRRHR